MWQPSSRRWFCSDQWPARCPTHSVDWLLVWIGSFGFTGCCSSIGSGIGFGMPVGGPTVAEASDQYVTSALINVPPDYQQHCAQYRLDVAAGNQRMAVAAPAPAT